jgi:hypothetical protein
MEGGWNGKVVLMLVVTIEAAMIIISVRTLYLSMIETAHAAHV